MAHPTENEPKSQPRVASANQSPRRRGVRELPSADQAPQLPGIDPAAGVSVPAGADGAATDESPVASDESSGIVDLTAARSRRAEPAQRAASPPTLQEMGVVLAPAERRRLVEAAVERHRLNTLETALLRVISDYALDHRSVCMLTRVDLMAKCGMGRGGTPRRRYGAAIDTLADARLVVRRKMWQRWYLYLAEGFADRHPALNKTPGPANTTHTDSGDLNKTTGPDVTPAHPALHESTGPDGPAASHSALTVGPNVKRTPHSALHKSSVGDAGDDPARHSALREGRHSALTVGPNRSSKREKEIRTTTVQGPTGPVQDATEGREHGGGGSPSPETIQAAHFEPEGDDPRLPDFRAWAADAHPEGWRPFSIERAWETYRGRNPIPPTPPGQSSGRSPVPVCEECGVAVGHGHAAWCPKAQPPPETDPDE